MDNKIDCPSTRDVWYRLPKKVSVLPNVCYTFPGQSEVCVIGDSYLLKPPPIVGGQCTNANYYVVAAIPCISQYDYQGVPPNTYYVGVQVSGKVYSATNWKKAGEGRTVTVTFGSKGGSGYNPWILDLTWDILYSSQNTSSTYLWERDFYAKTPSFERLIRADGTSEANDVAQCGSGDNVLEIYLNGNLHSSVSGQGNPSVRVLPASEECTFNNSQFSYGSKIEGNNIIETSYTNNNGDSCIKVLADNRKVLDVCSPHECVTTPQLKYTGIAKKCKPKKPECKNSPNTLLSNQLCTTECNSDTFYVHVLRENASREVVYPVNVKDVKGLKGYAQCVLVRSSLKGWQIIIETLNVSKQPVQTTEVITFNECPITSKFRVTCGTNKPNKPKEKNKCPPNTCYECEDDGYKCCYDGNFNLIKSFKIGE